MDYIFRKNERFYLIQKKKIEKKIEMLIFRKEDELKFIKDQTRKNLESLRRKKDFIENKMEENLEYSRAKKVEDELKLIDNVYQLNKGLVERIERII